MQIPFETTSVPDLQFADLLADVNFQPVFILGDHRSGTTLLYQLLDATHCFNVVRAYHVIQYNELLSHYVNQTEHIAKQQLSDRLAALGLTNRLIDGVKVTPDLPEEYGFVLRNAGYKAQLGPRNMPRFMELCKKVQYISQPGKLLLLKNPWDFMRFMYLRQIFPNAKFIFIHRNPIHIINSQIKATRSLFEQKNPYVALIADWYSKAFDQPVQLASTRLLFSVHLELGLRIVSRHVRLATSYFLQHIHALAEEDYIAIRYEDLCADPTATLQRILDFLGLPEHTNVSYDTFIQPRSAGLLAEVERNKEKIVKRLMPYWIHCGY